MRNQINFDKFDKIDEIQDAINLGKEMELSDEEIIQEIKKQGYNQSQINQYLSQFKENDSSSISVQDIKNEIKKVKAWIEDEENATKEYGSHVPLDPDFQDDFEDMGNDESRHAKKHRKYLQSLESMLNQ